MLLIAERFKRRTCRLGGAGDAQVDGLAGERVPPTHTQPGHLVIVRPVTRLYDFEVRVGPQSFHHAYYPVAAFPGLSVWEVGEEGADPSDGLAHRLFRIPTGKAPDQMHHPSGHRVLLTGRVVRAHCLIPDGVGTAVRP